MIAGFACGAIASFVLDSLAGGKTRAEKLKSALILGAIVALINGFVFHSLI